MRARPAESEREPGEARALISKETGPFINIRNIKTSNKQTNKTRYRVNRGTNREGRRVCEAGLRHTAGEDEPALGSRGQTLRAFS